MDITVDSKSAFAATGGQPFEEGRPTIVFIHGGGMDHSVWALQTRYFAYHGRNVLAVDLPGHGVSDGPALSSVTDMAYWLCQVADALGGPIHVVGHSMGAFIGLEASATDPDRIASLALLGVGATLAVHPDLQAAADANDPRAAALMAGWMHGPDQQFGDNPTPGMSMPGTTQATIESCPPGVLGPDLRACAAYDGAVTAASTVSCPTTLILGALDRMTPRKTAQPLVDAMVGATVVELAASGHAPMMEEPDTVRSVLGEHLARATA